MVDTKYFSVLRFNPWNTGIDCSHLWNYLGSETRIQVSEKNKLNTSYLLGLNSKLAKTTAEDISTCI